jgi:hypothetical protein
MSSRIIPSAWFIYYPTNDMMADTFTKALPSPKAKHFAATLGSDLVWFEGECWNTNRNKLPGRLLSYRQVQLTYYFPLDLPSLLIFLILLLMQCLLVPIK